jgi:hypothetical protein
MISVNNIETPARGKVITDSNIVDDIVKKFRSKYWRRWSEKVLYEI